MPNLKSLHVYFSSNKGIPPGTFARLPVLLDLTLENQELIRIGRGVFNPLKSAKRLNLRMDRIEEIESSAFDGMANLFGLFLDFNSLKRIDPDWFRDCPSLSIISLKGNLLGEIPEGAFKNLRTPKRRLELILTDNNLRSVDRGAFEGLDGLEVLRLDNNFIREISGVHFTSVKLIRKLDLRNNYLDDCDVVNFDRIKELYVAGNAKCDCVVAMFFSRIGKKIDIEADCK